MKSDTVYFDQESLLSVNTELLFSIFAHQKAIVQVLNEKGFVPEDFPEIVDRHRKKIMETMYEQYGHTPKL